MFTESWLDCDYTISTYICTELRSSATKHFNTIGSSGCYWCRIALEQGSCCWRRRARQSSMEVASVSRYALNRGGSRLNDYACRLSGYIILPLLFFTIALAPTTFWGRMWIPRPERIAIFYVMPIITVLGLWARARIHKMPQLGFN